MGALTRCHLVAFRAPSCLFTGHPVADRRGSEDLGLKGGGVSLQAWAGTSQVTRRTGHAVTGLSRLRVRTMALRLF